MSYLRSTLDSMQVCCVPYIFTQALAEHSQKDKAAVALHMTISLCGKSIPSALLLQHPECSENVSTLHDAVTARSLASVHVLLRAGASVDRRSHMGAECTALQYALAIKNIPAVEALLVAGEQLSDFDAS